MEVVARQAGVSRSTLYRRFPSRDALVTELGRQTFDFAMARLQTVAIDSGPAEPPLRRSAKVYGCSPVNR